MHTFLGDLRYGVRVLGRSPLYAIACIVTLALAIGPTAAIFSVVDTVLIRPLPYTHPDRLAFVWERDRDGSEITTGFRTFRDIQAGASALESVAATAHDQATLSDALEPERLTGLAVTWNYFGTLGVRPALGRDFTAPDDQPGRTQVVILSHSFWLRRFGGDRSVVGRAIPLDGRPITVVGVLPASYADAIVPGAAFFRPLGYTVAQPFSCRTCRHLTAIARIRDGIPRTRALAQLDLISAQLVRAFPKEYRAAGMSLEPVQRHATRAARPALLAILCAVALVLCIAVANVASLQLARAVRRDTEFSVRVALGAGSARLAQQLVAEGLVIASAGGLLGVALGGATLPLLVARLPQTLPRVDAIHLDLGALALVGLVVAGVALVLGLVPARLARKRLLFGGALRGAGWGGGADPHRTRSLLVVGEVALAVLLLASAGLLALSLTRLLAVDPGFEPRNLVTLRIQSTGSAYRTSASVLDYRDRALRAVLAVPDVVDAGTTTSLPLSGALDRFSISAEDTPLENPALAPDATGYRVEGDYLRTMRIRLLKGRDFAPQEMRDSTAAVVVVSQALARKLWRGEDPIGRRIHVSNARAPWSTVVGVAADVRHNSLDEEPGAGFYLPEPEWLWANDEAVLVVRTRQDSPALTRAIRAAVVAVDPSQPVTEVRTMDAVAASSAAQRRIALTLFGAFALLAVLLASAGVYGVLAASVAERTRELGLRSALGATPAELVEMVLSRGLGLAAIGVALGLAGSAVATRFLRSLLFGVAPTDPRVLGASALTLLAVAGLACLVPARRAVRVDPMVALRQ